MNIVIRVEVLGRELQGRLLLGLAAAERGHTAVILDKVTAIELSRTRLADLPAGYFHDNSPGQDGGKTVLHETLHGRGWQITGQDEEHGLTTDDFTANMGGRYPVRAMANKTAMFAFGAFDAEGIRAERPEFADRVLVTGSPRVDFWRKDLHGFYDRHPHPIGPDRPRFVLSVMSLSSFHAAGPQMSFADAGGSEEELLRRADAMADDGASTSVVESHRRVIRTKLALETLARRHPDVLFVQRPHPSEQPGAWEEVFADGPANIRVHRDNAVSPWVRNAACVIFESSTVGFEAAMAGVPVVRFATGLDDPTPASNRMGHLATTVDELSRIVDGVLAGAEPRMAESRHDAMIETLAERFFATDGRLAADRIVDAWESLASETVAGASTIRPSELSPPFSLGDLARRTVTGAMLWTGLAPRAMREQARRDRELRELKFPGFDLREVERIHQALVASLGRFANVRITQVRPRVLHLATD